jgi:hypothetical protein
MCISATDARVEETCQNQPCKFPNHILTYVALNRILFFDLSICGVPAHLGITLSFAYNFKVVVMCLGKSVRDA